MARYNLVLKHKSDTLNHVDYLFKLLRVDKTVKNNENITVLPDQLFTHALNLKDLNQEVWQSQEKLPTE